MAPSTSSQRTFTIASRSSALAQIQTNSVCDTLKTAFPTQTFETSFMKTGGDKDKIQALYVLGGKSLWTKELEVALKENAVDMLVHCLKDVPTVLPEGCKIGAILERESPLDAFVVKQGKEWKTLEDLPDGSVVGSSSIRRVSQLRRRYPHLVFKDARGNIDSRLSKLDDPESPYAALILAKAGLVRSNVSHRVTADVAAPTLYWAVGQGALAIEIRSDDVEAQALCDALTHWQTQYACVAERAFLRVLEGGCTVPVGVESTLTPATNGGKAGTLKITGTVTAIGGEKEVLHTIEEPVSSVADAEAVGVRLAQFVMKNGAAEILEEVKQDREKRIGESKSKAEVEKIEASMEAKSA